MSISNITKTVFYKPKKSKLMLYLTLFLTILISGYFWALRKSHNNVLPFKFISSISNTQTAESDPPTQVSNTDFKIYTTWLAQQPGEYSIYIEEINTSQKFEYNSTKNYYAASLYKLPVAIATLKLIQSNLLDWNTTVTYTEQDYADGSGTINSALFETKYNIRSLFGLLLDSSDNIAQNMLKRKIGDALIYDVIHRNFESGYELFARENITNTKDLGVFLKNIYTGSYLTQGSKEVLWEEMFSTNFDNRITAGLFNNLRYAHKIGNWPTTGSWHDCGIVFGDKDTLVVCLMSQNTTLERFIGVSSKLGEFISENFN